MAYANKIKVVKLFNSAIERNEWIRWDGTTSLVHRNCFYPHVSLEYLKDTLEGIRNQGDRFYIKEHVGIVLESRKDLKLILSCKEWNQSLKFEEIKKKPKLGYIKQWFIEQCKSQNIEFYCEYINENDFCKFDTYSSLYKFKSIPTRNRLSWSESKIETNKKYIFETFKHLQQKIYGN